MKEGTIKYCINDETNLGNFVTQAFESGMVSGKFLNGESFDITEASPKKKAPAKRKTGVKNAAPAATPVTAIKKETEGKVIAAISNGTSEKAPIMDNPMLSNTEKAVDIPDV